MQLDWDLPEDLERVSAAVGSHVDLILAADCCYVDEVQAHEPPNPPPTNTIDLFTQLLPHHEASHGYLTLSLVAHASPWAGLSAAALKGSYGCLSFNFSTAYHFAKRCLSTVIGSKPCSKLQVLFALGLDV